MSEHKRLIGKGRAIFASALCLFTCGLLAHSALAKVKVYDLEHHCCIPESFDGTKAQADAVAAFDLAAGERDGVWRLNALKYDVKRNPMGYFRDRDAVAYSNCVHSLKNVQQGELYTMRWDDNADYHMDEMLESGCSNSVGMLEWLCKNVLNDAPPPTPVTDLGCSAFAATNALGQQLAERNFDYRYRMTHALVYVPGNKDLKRPYASVSTVDCGWVGYDIGGLDNGTNDLSCAALFPHIPLDGMNEKGLMVTVLSLDARTNGYAMTEQYFPDRTNIVTTVAIRYLLDNADSTEAGINMLTNNFNMFQAIGGDIPIAANYHFYLCDKSGDARVVEWLPPTDGSPNWKTWVTNATSVSNFYLHDGYGHGSNRWEIMRHALARQNGHLEVPDAMHLARAVAQHKGAEQTSWTHWSIVYNLTDLSAHIATLGNYDEIFPYRLDLDAPSDWTTEAPKSARPVVETNLPPFEATVQAGAVYRLADPISGSSGAPSSHAGASVAAVNRLGLTYDATGETLHAVATNGATAKCRAVFYVDMSSKDPGRAACSIVAGVSEKGLAGRVVRFRNSTGSGELSPSTTLMSVLNDSETFEAALKAMGESKQSEGGCGFVLSDAMGNVAVWGPAGAELETDDASEMVRNSLDLRKGIYETDGDGRGQFDELPGLMRLASSADTKAIVSMGYGHLDVMLPESNVVWRVAMEGVSVPAYGVVAEPPAVAHTTATLTYTNGSAVATNNQGRLVAETNAMLRVAYVAEPGYCFTDGARSWTRDFPVGGTATTPPAPETAPICPRDPDYAAEDGHDWLFNHDIAAKRYEGEPAEESGVDLFYFYPTSVNVSDDRCVDGICDIDDPYLRGPDGATNSWNMTAKVFGDFTRVYAPYYRQTPADVEMSFPRDGTGYDKITQYWYERAPYADVTNALAYYFTQINPDGERPFVFAGHSHGAGMLILAMEHFFKDHPAWLRNMVACYAIGMGVSDKWEESVRDSTGVTIATNATDAGVYVFWNTEGPGTSEEMIGGLWPTNHVPGVNPLTWTRTGEYAPASLNLGGWTADDSGAVEPGLYDASNNVAHGTVVCSSPDLVEKYMDAAWGFGEKSLHGWDYKLYWRNLRVNALQRIGAVIGGTCGREVIEGDETKVLNEGKIYKAPASFEDGGAFHVEDGGTLVGTNVTFVGNEVSGYGGVMWCNGFASLVGDIVFADNRAEIGGALDNDGTIYFDGDTAWTGNSASGRGGAIRTVGTVIFFGKTVFSGNASPNGGAIHVDEDDSRVDSGTVAFCDGLTLATDTDTIVNKGALVWDFRANSTPCLNGYQNVINDGGALQLSVDDSIAVPSSFVIATGDFTDLAGKDTFAVVAGEEAKTVQVGEKGWAVVGNRDYRLTVGENGLVLDVKEHETAQELEVTVYNAEKPYDGTPLTSQAYEITSGGDALERAGHTLTAAFSGSIVDVGSVSNRVTFTVRDGAGADVTSRYGITVKGCVLTVTKAAGSVVITPNPPRASDGAANGYTYTGLVAGDSLFATVSVSTNADKAVVCRIDGYAITRGGRDVTANYAVVTEEYSSAGDPNAERTVVSSSKDTPKVAKGEEVTYGSPEKPALVVFETKTATFSVGSNAKYALHGEMRNATAVKVAAGTKTRENGESVQNRTTADLGRLVGTSKLTSGSFADVTLDYLSGTEKADGVTVGAKSVFTAGDIDLGAGNDKLSVGVEASFEAGDLYDVESLSFGSRSTNEIGNVVGAQKLTVAAGKSPTSKAEAVPTMLVAGDVEMSSNKANAVTLGKYTETSFGDVVLGEKNDRITVGDSSTALFGCIGFGGGKDTVTVGKNCTVVMVAYEEDCASLTKFTLGKGTVAYLSSELIAKGRELSGRYGFGEDATVVDIGPADVARLFRTLEDERADNEEATARTLSTDVEGWLSDVKDADGVALDADDFLVADRPLVVNVAVSAGNTSKVVLYVNGVRQTSPFGRDLSIRTGDVLRLHKGQGEAAAGYAIKAYVR